MLFHHSFFSKDHKLSFFFVCLNQQPRSEESVQARYPQSSTEVLQPGRAAVNRIEQVHIATSGEETPT